VLNNLNNILRVQFEETGDLRALARAVQAGRDAVAAAPPGHGNRASALSSLGSALRAMFEATADPQILAEAVQVGRDAVAGTPPGHPGRAGRLSNLSSALKSQAEQTGDAQVLAEAVQLGQDAVAAIPPGRPGRARYLSNLGNALQTLFDQTGNQQALTEAVQLGRDAVAATPPGHPDRAGYLSNLGNALGSLFEQTGDRQVLDEAVQACRDAAAASPPGHPDHAMYAANLSVALLDLFERVGDQQVLAEAVQVDRDALAATPPSHPDRARRLSTLAGALRALFAHTGDLQALAEAVQAARDAVAATPHGHPERAGRLSNLGIVLRALSERTGDLQVLAEAVQAARDAAAAALPGHPERASYLNILAGALLSQGERTGSLQALTEAAQANRDAVATTPRDQPDRAQYSSNLGLVLRIMFARTGDLQVLTEAVQAGREAVAATPKGNPAYAMYSANLALVLETQFDRTGDLQALAQAKDAFAEAAAWTAAPARTRINRYRGLGRTAMSAGDSAGTLAAFESAIALLPQIASRGLSYSDREHGLGEFAGLAAEAASAAISAGRPDRAVELLEQARGVLIADVMEARGDLSDLEARAPVLAARFMRLRDELDAAEDTRAYPGDRDDVSLDVPDPGLQADGEAQRLVMADWTATASRRLATRRQELAQEWDSLLAQIRNVDGLQGFLLPLPVSALMQEAADGPVVMVNVSEYRCDALILTADASRPVRVVELPGLGRNDVFYQINRLGFAVVVSAEQSLSLRLTAQREIRTVLAWLWDKITAPVLAELNFTGRPEPGRSWPRVWWCPVGEMAFMPLHAAGYHDSTHADLRDGGWTADAPTVLDRVISSYTPTIRALRYARQDRGSVVAGPAVAQDGALIVAMPETGEASALPSVQIEAERIAELLPGSVTLTGPQATRSAVLAALANHRVAHLACHGLSDSDDPASSRLLLYDHTASPLTVTAISQLRLSSADLAYLSACSTTGSNQRLADQVVHITGAFQLAGYKHVIGTLWPINDSAAAEIADDIYSHLTDNGRSELRIEETANVVHDATLRLRQNYPASPAIWAAHIHAGV
jgi:tetratricopeptide (TPR) repeat protein